MTAPVRAPSTETFPRTILEEVKQKLEELPPVRKSLEQRFLLQSIKTMLESGITRDFRTAQFTKECGTNEQELYRVIGKPLHEQIAEYAFLGLDQQFLSPRSLTLLDTSIDLTLDETMSFPTAVTHWSEKYAAIANPAAIFEAEFNLRTFDHPSLIASHAAMIEKNVRLIAKGRANLIHSFGMHVVTLAGAIDMVPDHHDEDLRAIVSRTIMDSTEK